MAEKVTLLEVDIDINAAAKDAKALKEEIALLKAQTEKAKKEQGEFSKEYIQYQAALKSTQKDLRTQENLIIKSTQAQNAATGSIDQLRNQLSVVSVQWAKLSKEERENTEEGQKLTKQKLELTNALKAEEKATGDSRRNVGNYSEGMQEALGATSQFIPVAGQATGAAKALGVALKVMISPLGLVLAAFAAIAGALKAFFTSSEEGQNVLNKLKAVFQVVFGNIIDIASKLGEALVNAVTKPREAWESFKNFIKGIGEFFQNTFGNIIGGFFQKEVAKFLKGFAAIGLAWQKLKNVFTDNADGINKAQERINELNERIEKGNEKIQKGAGNLGTSIKNTWNRAKEGLQGYIKEQEREINIAKQLADQQAALDKQIRNNLVLEAQDRLKLEQVKNKIDEKDKQTAQERLALIDEQNKILDEILQRNIDIARQKLAIKQAQNDLSNSTKEDLDEEAQLLADIFNLEASITAQRKEAIAKRIEAENQILAEAKAATEETINNLYLELDTYLLTNQSKIDGAKELTQALIEEEEARLTAINEKKAEALALELENELISREEFDLAILEQEVAKTEALTELKVELEEQERERKAEAAAIDFENDMIIAEGNLFAEFDLQSQWLEKKRKQEIKYAVKTGADVSKINKKYAKAQRALDIAEVQAKLSLAASATQGLAAIAGEQTEIGKAAAVASATISTIQGGISAFTGMVQSIPGPVGIALGVVAAAGVLASGYAQVKEILSVKSGLPSGGGGGGASLPSASAPSVSVPQAQATNVTPQVGAGIVSRDAEDSSAQSVSNGVSQALEETPIQPTLVEDDVTSKQNDRTEQTETSVI